MAGSLSVEAQEQYRLIRDLLVADVPPHARVVDLDAASGTASPCWPPRTSTAVARLLRTLAPAIVVGDRPWE